MTTSPTRGASLVGRVGSPSGIDLDRLGNLRQTAGGVWSTDVQIFGTSGDLVILMSGVGFNDFITDPMFPGVPLENTAVYQNLLGSGIVLPGMVTASSLSVALGAGSVTVGIATIPPSGVLNMTVNFGAFSMGFREAEAHLQAIVLDPTGTLVQSTNRLPIDLNE